MSEQNKAPEVDQVLDRFIAEADTGRETLQRYLKEYPQFNVQLLDLARELALISLDTALSETSVVNEDEQIEALWQRYKKVATEEAVLNPFAELAVPERRDLAKQLGLKLQVIGLFAEARIALWTVPSTFLQRMASTLNTSVDALIAGLLVSGAKEARSYKSDVRPSSTGLIDFAQAIEDSGATDDERQRLLHED